MDVCRKNKTLVESIICREQSLRSTSVAFVCQNRHVAGNNAFIRLSSVGRWVEKCQTVLANRVYCPRRLQIDYSAGKAILGVKRQRPIQARESSHTLFRTRQLGHFSFGKTREWILSLSLSPARIPKFFYLQTHSTVKVAYFIPRFSIFPIFPRVDRFTRIMAKCTLAPSSFQNERKEHTEWRWYLSDEMEIYFFVIP